MAEAAHTAPGPRTLVARSSGSLRRRLLAAFVGLSALVAVAAAIAVFALWLNRQSHDRIARQSIPIATTALDLTRVAQDIVDTVPDLVAAKDAEAQAHLTSALGERVDQLDALLTEMSTYEIEARSVASIERAAALFAANIEAINRMVSARIAVEAVIASKVVSGRAAVDAVQALLQGYIEDRGEGLARVLESDPTIIAERLVLLRAHAGAREIGRLLDAYATGEAGGAASGVDAALGDLRAATEAVSPADRAALSRNGSVIAGVLSGGSSLAGESAFRSQLDTAAQQALQENADLAGRFGAAVDRMVAAAKSDVADANAQAAEVQRTASWLLLSVVLASILSSFLIVRIYVYRDILARLTALTGSMMAIAGGDLSAPIPEPSRDELGSMASALNVFRDTAVEVRDSNLREIRETRTRLYHAIENIQEGFALSDSEGRLTLTNARFGTLLLGREGVVEAGAAFDEVLVEMADAGIVTTAPADWLAEARAYHRDPNGTLIWELAGRWVGLTERCIDDGGRVMVVTDLTAIKRHEQELDALVEQLQRASVAKSSFIANVSHELRTPLTAVLGFAQIVQSRLQNVLFPAIPQGDRKTSRAMEQIRKNMEIMILEGQRLTKMINDILDLEKIEAGQMVWEIEPLDMASVIRQAAAATSSLYTSKGLAFHIDVTGEFPPVMGDRDRLVQVLINLISNAVKFTDRGHVACTARKGAGPFVQVSVSDTGIGIAPDDQAEVFDKFRQVGDTMTEKPAGTGLGLPICREIVEHLGGAITVESMPGYGSTFTFQLPVAEAGAKAIEAERRAYGT